MKKILVFLISFSVVLWLIGTALAWVRESPQTNRPWSGAKFIDLPSGRVHYIDLGPKEASAILLFHGSGRGIADWQEGFGEALARNHRVVGFDYYGNGFSDRGFGMRYGYQLWSEQAIELLNELGIDEATFAGHSVGGVIAAITSVDHPRRSNSLVTIGTGASIDPVQIIPLIPGVGEFLLGVQPRFSETFSEQHREFIDQAHNIRGTRGAFLVYIRRQYTIDGIRVIKGLFDKVSAPALHVSGSMDRSIPHEAAQKIALQTDGVWAPFDGVGHDVHIEEPELLAQQISDFIEGLPE